MADDKDAKKPGGSPTETVDPDNLSEEDLKKAAGGGNIIFKQGP